jgi:hypothetical protein
MEEDLWTALGWRQFEKSVFRCQKNTDFSYVNKTALSLSLLLSPTLSSCGAPILNGEIISRDLVNFNPDIQG